MSWPLFSSWLMCEPAYVQAGHCAAIMRACRCASWPLCGDCVSCPLCASWLVCESAIVRRFFEMPIVYELAFMQTGLGTSRPLSGDCVSSSLGTSWLYYASRPVCKPAIVQLLCEPVIVGSPLCTSWLYASQLEFQSTNTRSFDELPIVYELAMIQVGHCAVFL